MTDAVGNLARLQRARQAHSEQLALALAIDNEDFEYRYGIGEQVWKPKGYSFEGTIVARFITRARQERYVVESYLSPGMLHIFNPDQLEVI